MRHNGSDMGSPNLPPLNLPENAVWFVTGTSSGIGSSLIESILSNKGYRVVALSRNPASIPLPQTSNDTNTLLQPVDLRSENSIKLAFEAALEKFGRIDVVVNNAGYGLFGELESTSTQDGRDLFEINYWAPVHITRQAIRIMRDVNPTNGPIGGIIAQVSSIGGYIAAAGSSFYHSTKWALEGFTESIDKELDPTWNIRFAIIEPGSVKTKWSGENMKGRDREQHEAYRNKQLMTDKLRDMRIAFEDKIGASADKVAELIVKVMKDEGGKWGGRNMLRLPVGADAWALMKNDIQAVNESADKWKVESESTSTGDVKATLRSIGILRD